MSKNTPLYIQHEKAECGYACIAMMLAYFGHFIDMHELRHRFGKMAQGLSLFQIRHIFLTFNFNSQALQISLSDLVHLACPVLLHWDLDHFVVLTKIKKKPFLD